MKKFAVVFLCLAALVTSGFVLVSCGKRASTPQDTPIGAESVQITSPIEEFDTLEDAAKAAGFSLSVPDSIRATGYYVIGKEILEVGFDTGYLRKAVGSGDISGCYTTYENTQIETLDGKTVTLKGNGEQIMLALWSADGYSYSIGSDGMSAEAMSALIAAVQ
ncbi:MAG: hypothetical protein ACI4I5_00985 [Acutalibacteraceae bacterium]